MKIYALSLELLDGLDPHPEDNTPLVRSELHAVAEKIDKGLLKTWAISHHFAEKG